MNGNIVIVDNFNIDWLNTVFMKTFRYWTFGPVRLLDLLEQ